MKVAAIDIGSNSIHLIVVDVYPDGHYVVVDKAKDMVGLARNTLANGYLSDKAMNRGLNCLKTFARMCKEHGVSKINAVATSAVREALNGEHFLKRVRDECGMEVRVISGEEEARLIYLGCHEHIDWGNRRALIVDIGGGSVEFIVGDEERAEKMVSLLLGVRRISERCLVSDPPRKQELKRLKQEILEGLEGLKRELGGFDFDFVVGTSGTLNNLAKMAARRNGQEVTHSQGLWTSYQDLKEMARALSGLTDFERRNYHGVDSKRVDTIVAGAQLIKYVLQTVGKDSYIACEYALRDGIIVDHIQHHARNLKAVNSKPRLRRRSVRRMVSTFNRLGGHPKEVKRLALDLFDQLRSYHGLNDDMRELVGYSALLHDVGVAVNHKGHNAHSAYLIMHSELRGFTDDERLMMAKAVSLHRPDHDGLEPRLDIGKLGKKARRKVMFIAAIIRIADALDRAQSGNVVQVKIKADPKGASLRLKAYVQVDTGLEGWAIEKKGDLFEELTGLKLVPDIRMHDPGHRRRNGD